MADSIAEQPGVSHDEGKMHRGGPGKDSVYSWVLVGCASFSLSVIVGLMMGCSSMFFVELLEEFGEGKEKTAWVGSVATAMLTIPGPLAAFLSKRYDSLSVTFTGSVLLASGLLLSSFAPSLDFLLVSFSIVGGVGSGLVYTVSYVVVTKAFERYQSLAVGLLSSGAVVGVIVYPPLIRFIIDKVGLWQGFRFLAGIAAVCPLLSLCFPLDASPAQHSSKDNHGGKARGCLPRVNLSLLRSPPFLLLTLILSLAYLGYYIPFQHMLQYAEEQGLSKDSTAFFVTYYGITSSCCRIFWGKLMDMYSHVEFLSLYIAQFGLIGVGVAACMVCGSSSYYSFLMYFIIYGILDAGFIGQQCVIVLKVVGHKDLAMGWGIITLSYSVTIALGAPLGGFIAEYFNSYEACFYFAGATIITAGVLLSLVPWCAAKLPSPTRTLRTEASLLHTVDKIAVV